LPLKPFSDNLQNYMAQNLQAYNTLMGPTRNRVQMLPKTLASGGMQLGQGIMGAFGGVGNTLGGATMGAGNALSGGIQALTGGAGSAMMMPYMAQMYRGGQSPISYGTEALHFKMRQNGLTRHFQ